MMFLKELALAGSEGVAAIVLAVISVFMGLFVIFVFFGLGIYIYSSFAYMTIAKKAKHDKPWLAWIPLVGKPLLSANIAKMDWWPILFLGGILLYSIPVFGFFLGYAFVLTFLVFFFIWRWKMYEKVGHPGWFSLMFLLPVVGHVLLGIVAWSKENIIEPANQRKNQKTTASKTKTKK